jgi:hypothetical protein
VIAALPEAAALRREQIRLQVALANTLMHTKGYTAPETRASLDQARLFIERMEALGEPPEDPLLRFSVLMGFFNVNFVAFNGDVIHELAAQFLALAEKQGATVPLMLGHRIMGTSLLMTGDITESLTHYDRVMALTIPMGIARWQRVFWPRQQGGNLGLSIVGSVVDWPSQNVIVSSLSLSLSRETSRRAMREDALPCSLVALIPPKQNGPALSRAIDFLPERA